MNLPHLVRGRSEYAVAEDTEFPSRRDVAQPGSALAWGARGRRFKSARPDHSFSTRKPAGTVEAFNCRPTQYPKFASRRAAAATKKDCKGCEAKPSRGGSNPPVPTIPFPRANLLEPLRHSTADPRSTPIASRRAAAATKKTATGARRSRAVAVQIRPSRPFSQG